MSIGNDLPEYAWLKQIRNGTAQLLNTSAAYHPQTRQEITLLALCVVPVCWKTRLSTALPHTKRGILLELSVLLDSRCAVVNSAETLEIGRFSTLSAQEHLPP